MGISRLALWNAIGGVSVVEPLLLEAYAREGEREWRQSERPATSFYISNFPGTDPKACGRAALYRLMNFPEEKPFEPKVRSYMDTGKALELFWTTRFAAEGALISGNESAGEKQTRLTDPISWASGAVDAIILPPFWRKGHCVEIKTTAHEKVAAMRSDRENTIYSHAKYVRQLLTYIGLSNEQNFAPKVTVCRTSWAVTTEFPMNMRYCPVHRDFNCETREVQLEAPTDGTLIYSSRDEPLYTASYYFEIDRESLAAGREKLIEWRGYYDRGEIPPHPLEGEKRVWSAPPCNFCGFKKSTCKPDYTGKVAQLSESHGIEFTRKVRGDYDFDAIRAAVFARWEVDDPLPGGEDKPDHSEDGTAGTPAPEEVSE